MAQMVGLSSPIAQRRWCIFRGQRAGSFNKLAGRGEAHHLAQLPASYAPARRNNVGRRTQPQRLA